MYGRFAIFDTRITPKTSKTAFYFSEKFIQFSTRKNASDIIYGLGERMTSFKLKNGMYTIFPYSQEHTYDHGNSTVGGNLYGHHPFYIKCMILFDIWTGVYIHTTSPLDFIIDDEFITTRAINGIIDLYILPGSNRLEVVKKYHKLIGKPSLMPFWAFGWHVGKEKYGDYPQLMHVITQHHENNIPLDGIWHSQEYADHEVPFKYVSSSISNSDTREVINNITETFSTHYMVMIDEGIGNLNYPPFVEGERMGVFLKDITTNEYLSLKAAYGEGWVIDYFHPNASIYWENILERLRKDLSFSGKYILLYNF